MEDDGLVEHCQQAGAHLHSYRERLLNHPTVKDVRGKGLFMVCELVKDKQSMEFFDRDQHAEQRYQSIALKNGLVMYGALYGERRAPGLQRGLPTWISPPLCITVEQIDDLIERYDATLGEWENELGISN